MTDERLPGPEQAIMDTLQQQIAAKFLAKLVDSTRFDRSKVEKLRKLLRDSKKPKPDDFVKVFTLPAGGDVK